MRTLVYILCCLVFISCSKNEINIAYQGMANPWKALIANEKFNELTNKKINWKQFDSGSKVINAMVSGGVDIAVIGSTPLASAASRELPLKMIWAMEIIGKSEALVVRKSIQSAQNLKGKRIAVPFGSTTHYHFLLYLKLNDIKPNELEIVNLSPAGIVAGWEKGQIDGAFVWAPSLEALKEKGRVLISSDEIAQKGYPTFDAIVARNSFLENDPGFINKFLNEVNQLHLEVNSNNMTTENQKVQTIANFVGAKPNDVVTSLKGYTFPTKKQQIELMSSELPKAIKMTSEFLLEQDKIQKVLNDYTPFIDSNFAKGLQ